MRKLLLVLGIVIVAVIGLSPIAGGVVTSRVLETLEERPTPLAAGLVLRQAGHERGLFSTTATSELGTAGAGEPLRIEHTLYHGPLPYARLGLAPALAVIESRLVPAAGAESPLHARTIVALDRSVRIEIDGQRYEGGGLRFDGAEGEIELAPDGTRWLGQLAIQGFQAIGAQGPGFALGETRLDVDLTAAEGGIPEGTLRYTVESARLPALGLGQSVRLRELAAEYQSASGAKEGTLDTTTKLRLAELFVGELEYRDGDLEVTTRNMDTEAIAALRDAQSEAGSTGPANEALRTALLEQLPTLVEDGVEIEISRGSVITPNGLLEVSGKLSGRPEMAEMLRGGNMNALSAAFDVELDLDVSENHFARIARSAAELQAGQQGLRVSGDQIDQMAQALVDVAVSQGYVSMVEADGARRFRSNLRYKNNTIQINGRPLDIAALARAAAAGAPATP